MNRLFEQTYNQIVKEGNTNIKTFINEFDNRFTKYLDEKEEDLRDPIERMISEMKMSAMKWK